jgi:hypothetical protein
MPAYRIYIITSDGHITAPAHGIESEDEQEAISKAAQAANGKAAGLWEARAFHRAVAVERSLATAGELHLLLRHPEPSSAMVSQWFLSVSALHPSACRMHSSARLRYS